MKINEYIKTVTTAPEDAGLMMIKNKIDDTFNQFYASFFAFKTLVDLERENYPKNIECKLNERLSSINEKYRELVLHVDKNYKREGIFVWSYAGKNLTDIIGSQFNFNFNKNSYKDRVRLKYTREKIINSMVSALSLLFAKYQVVYDFQIKMTLLKLIVDFIDYKTINHLELNDLYSQILNLDINVIKDRIKQLDITPKVKIKKERKRRVTVELPSKEEIEYWLNSGQYTRTQLEEIIAKQFNISTITVHRKIVEYGLTRSYNLNKK